MQFAFHIPAVIGTSEKGASVLDACVGLCLSCGSYLFYP